LAPAPESAPEIFNFGSLVSVVWRPRARLEILKIYIFSVGSLREPV
jgi:hypothetical protein